MKFNTRVPVKIIMLGAGGTGGYIARDLYRLLYALDRKIRFIIVDGDLVEAKNLIRQNFAPGDIGENKAKVLAERYCQTYGLETEFVPHFIENEKELVDLVEPRWLSQFTRFVNGRWVKIRNFELSILIGAVDNNKSRIMCHSVFQKVKPLVYIDSGNGHYSGQVICGIRNWQRTVRPPVGDVYPLLDNDKFPSQLSCAEAAVSSPQSIMANISAATAVLSMVYDIVALGELNTFSTVFDSRRVQTRPVSYNTAA